jgi:hypothetical protein
VPQGIPRPDGLPLGPLRDLAHALHELYRDAGMPSTRMISSGIRKCSDLRDTVSHETVGLMLRGEGVPRWIKLECVVRHLAVIAVRQPDVDTMVRRFHELWLAAVAADQAGGAAPDPHVAAAGSPGMIAASVLPAPLLKGMSSAPAMDLRRDLPQRNGNFTGREDLLDQIHRSLSLRTQSTMAAQPLHGLGGVGKSQIAVEFAYRYQSNYQLMWWVQADDERSIRRSLVSLARRLGLLESEDVHGTVDTALRALQRGEPHSRWLLIYDKRPRAQGRAPVPAVRPGACSRHLAEQELGR